MLKSALFRKKSISLLLQENATQDALSEASHSTLKKTLNVWDLTALGIAAVLGAGVFSTIGHAAANGGPAVAFLFLFTAIACGFSALCYAEFASAIPLSGSAYTYAYASYGELIAWVIGWDLLMEYAIGNIAMAISWSQYFTGFLASYGVIVPKYLTLNILSASKGFHAVSALMAQGIVPSDLPSEWIHHELSVELIRGYWAWIEAPRIFGLPFILDLPALAITGVITAIVYCGIEESKRASNFLVLLKIAVVLLVIFVGFTYVQPANWSPFMPHGVPGVLKGVSAVFFAYIGFDAISTTAEECQNPQRDIPRGMIFSLLICTTLYILTALVLTGMTHYSNLAVGDPLAFVFGPQGVNLPWMAGVVNISALIALATVLLVFQVGQPRIWMAMSRDGLLPPLFAAIHPKFRTPWFATLVTGFVVAVPSLFMSLPEVTDLTSIGTLFAFMIVCAGTLKLHLDRANDPAHPEQHRFKIPYINSQYLFPSLMLSIFIAVATFNPEGMHRFWTLSPSEVLHPLEAIQQRIPLSLFGILMMILSYLCWTRKFSIIPVLGLSSCSYLMTELGITNWIRFGIWLILGGIIYFSYGFRKSRLNQAP